MRFILRSLIFVHRWVGIVLCVVFLLWFPSGIGMMYWGMPSVTAQDRLDRSPKLDASKILLSPGEAAEKVGMQASPNSIRLNSFDGRPVYRIGGGGGRGGNGGAGGARGGGGSKTVYADTGEEQTEVSSEMLDRIASSWSGLPVADAKKVSVEAVDQWTVGSQLRNLRPMYTYTWPDGQVVYLNGTTGEVVQYTTFWSRVAAHVSAIPHWIYYTPLRQNQPVWINFMIYSSLIGTVGAFLGMIAAVWMYSPKQKYRLAGQPTGVPYKGQKRWHWILGIVFGVATITWTFSGLMSLGPFPLMQRLTGQTPRPERQVPAQPAASQATQTQPQPQQQATIDAQRGAPPVESAPRGNSRGERSTGQSDRGGGQRSGSGRGGGRRGGQRAESSNATAPAADARGGQAAANQGAARGGGGRGGGQQGIAGALRGRVGMADFASVHPKDLLAKVPDLDVKELEWTSFASTPMFSANLSGGKNQLLNLDGTRVDGYGQEKVVEIIKGAVPDPKAIEIKVLDQYDLYYRDRNRERPLPVLLVLMNDADETRYYVDPKSARVLTTYTSRNWVNRWLYTGLHSLNFPFLYNHRPLWDIVVITFMVGGTALCVTSLVLAWRVLGRKLKRVAVSDVLAPER